MVLLLTNTLCTLCLRGRRFHTMSFYNCNILQGASIKELFRFSQLQVRLLGKVHLYKCFVGMRGRNGGDSSATWWHVQDCLEVCLVGLVVGRIFVWCLVSCHIYGIWTSRSKKVWGMLKSHQLGVGMQGGSSHREGRFSLCNTAVL